jgi:hypothetical protein
MSKVSVVVVKINMDIQPIIIFTDRDLRQCLHKDKYINFSLITEVTGEKLIVMGVRKFVIDFCLIGRYKNLYYLC